jgi:hypothetical protein
MLQHTLLENFSASNRCNNRLCGLGMSAGCKFTWHDMIMPGWWVWIKMDYVTIGSVPLFTNRKMTGRHTHCDIDFSKDVSFSCAIVVFANMHHRIIFSIRTNNVSFQTAIVKVLHVPCSVHEPLARGSVN